MLEAIREIKKILQREKVTNHGTAFLLGDELFSTEIEATDEEKSKAFDHLNSEGPFDHGRRFNVSLGPAQMENNYKKTPVFLHDIRIGSLGAAMTIAFQKDLKTLGFNGCYGSAEATSTLSKTSGGEVQGGICVDLIWPLWVVKWEIWLPQSFR